MNDCVFLRFLDIESAFVVSTLFHTLKSLFAIPARDLDLWQVHVFPARIISYISGYLASLGMAAAGNEVS